jgi:hypothetical protein
MRTALPRGESRDVHAFSFHRCGLVCRLRIRRLWHHAALHSQSHGPIRRILLCTFSRIRHSGELDHVFHPPLARISHDNSERQFKTRTANAGCLAAGSATNPGCPIFDGDLPAKVGNHESQCKRLRSPALASQEWATPGRGTSYLAKQKIVALFLTLVRDAG